VRKAIVVVLLAAGATLCAATETKTFPLRYSTDMAGELGNARTGMQAWGFGGTSERPEGIEGEPKYASKEHLYFLVPRKGRELVPVRLMGVLSVAVPREGYGPGIACVLDESEGTGKGYDTLYVDGDGDLDLTNAKALKGEPVKDANWMSRSFGTMELPLRVNATVVPCHVAFAVDRFRYAGSHQFETNLFVRPAGCFIGDIELGRKYRVLFYDGYVDGAIVSFRDAVAALKLGQKDEPPRTLSLQGCDDLAIWGIDNDGKVDAAFGPAKRVPCGALTELGGKLVRIFPSDGLKSVVVEQPEAKLGQVALADPAVRATLISTEAQVILDADRKQMACPAGEYFVVDYEVQKADKQGTWRLQGRGTTAGKPIVVQAGQTAQVQPGGPLRLLVDVRGAEKQDGLLVVRAGQEASLRLMMLGAYEEECRTPAVQHMKGIWWGLLGRREVTEWPAAPRFVITNEAGKKVAFGKFTYG